MCHLLFFFFFNDTATTEIYTLSLHDALPISVRRSPAETGRGPDFRSRGRTGDCRPPWAQTGRHGGHRRRSEEHTSELQSLAYLVCRLLLEKKKNTRDAKHTGRILSHHLAREH